MAKSPYEGRSAREMFGKPKTPEQIVRDQCKANAQKGGTKKKS